MTATYLGSVSIGAAVPGAAASAAAGADGLNAAFPDIAARVAALASQLAELATLPPLPSFAAILAQAEATVAAITLAMSTPGLPPPPSISTAIAALTAQLGALQTLSVTLNDQLSLVVAFQAQLAAAGVHLVAFDGTASQLGTQLDAALSGHVSGSADANAVALVTTDSATWAAMSQVFKVTA